jgi:transcription antitermination factor NusG
MPILPAEPEINPPNLWDVRATAWAQERLWWCLHTKPRQEKAVARDLKVQGVPFYLPQVVNEAHTPQGRKTRSVLPLFTSYLFLFGDDRERVQALKGNRLVRVLDVPDQESINCDLSQIYRMLASGLVVSPEPTMPVGARVRILNGPLTGMEGRVVRRGKRDQFVALVHFLGSGAAVNLEDWQVERLDDDEPV